MLVSSVTKPRRLATAIGREQASLFAGIFVSYLLGARIAFWLIDATDLSAVMFPPAGITVGALLLVERRQWPIVLLAAGMAELVMDLWMDVEMVKTLGFVFANTAEPLVGASLTCGLLAGDVLELTSRRRLWSFIAGAVMVGPAVGAGIGAATVVGSSQSVAETAGQWWLGDALGALIVGGVIVTWKSTDRQRSAWSPLAIVLFLTSSVGVLAILAMTDLPLLFIALTAIVVAGAQFGVRTAAIAALFTVCAAMIWLPFESGALFTGMSTATGVVVVKLKFLVFTTAGLTVAAISAELTDAAALAAKSRAELEAEHRVVVQLQRLVLPPGHIEGATHEAHGLYVPASTELGVGGDWYEIADLPDGRTLVAVGDIVGSGATAAAHTSRLRAMITVLANAEPDVGRLLRSFETHAAWLPGVVSSTIWLAIHDPATRELSYTSAGHPPAYLVDAAGVKQLALGLNPVVGFEPDQPKASETVKLQGPTTLVVYTDGLIERPGEPLDTGFARLERSLRRLTPPVTAELLWKELEHDGLTAATDDTILLTVNLT